MSVEQIAATKPDGTHESLPRLNEWANLSAFGRDRVSLTEWNTSTIPEVAIGSIWETGGALYQCTSNTAIGGSPLDGTCYILFNDSTETFQFTNTLPVWDSEKHGYYDTATGYKALNFSMIKSGTDYEYKKITDFESRIFSNNNHAFEVYHDGLISLSPASSADVELTTQLDTIKYNIGDNYNTTTGRFTAPENGFYCFYYGGQLTSGSYWGIVLNSSDFISIRQYSALTNSTPEFCTTYLNKDDYVSIFYSGYPTWGVARITLTTLNNYLPKFGGYKIG